MDFFWGLTGRNDTLLDNVYLENTYLNYKVHRVKYSFQIRFALPKPLHLKYTITLQNHYIDLSQKRSTPFKTYVDITEP